ncbi:PQQ-binding-like beta-propeller repeat protein [Saccharothrix variisporea]|uniref:Putative pyrroloquinoline-quinone binding quinoprotein n=1 Tax=Saccharothrix variisporea TaxID=543527 RepID=A0A495X0Q5_9PSEU|nr:PQQ-binding-like beta-propeller repeat protein [Saccharothrix variisporea]RKT67490.1 putative pyrroloquinoline-quinone binding quinoprotein [Saccharothrix variisporea]
MLRYVTLVGAVAAGVAPFLSGGAARSDVVDTTVIGLAVGVVAVALLACVRGARVVAVCGALVAVGACGWLLAVEVGTGLVGARVPVLAAGALCVAVGAGWSGSWRVTVVGALAAVVAAGVSAVAPLAAEAGVVRSEVSEARHFPPEEVVERPGGVQWAWQPRADVVGVVAAGHGVVVALGDGSLVALSGTDGREDWRYGRVGAHVGALVASVDRKTVVATFRTGRDTRQHLMVVLDADTGAVRFSRLVRGVLAEVDAIVPGTATVALPDGDELVGYDLGTGASRWRWGPAGGCGVLYVKAVRGRSTVFVAEECPDRISVVALDEVSGERRWEHRVPLARDGGERRDVHLLGAPDGSLVSVRVVTADVAPGAVTEAVFDAETGVVVARPGREWWVRADLGPRLLLEDEANGSVVTLDSTGAVVPLDAGTCARVADEATTATTYLRACDDNGRDVTVVTQGLDGSAVVRTPVRLDGSGSLGEVHLVPAPGAIVVARSAYGGTPAPVVGLTGRG